MSQAPSYMDHGSVPASAPPMTHYSGYPPHQPMHVPSHSFSSTPGPVYPEYGYQAGIPPMHPASGHPSSAGMPSQLVHHSHHPLPTIPNSASSAPASGSQFPGPNGFDTTGQIAPHGMKPRVTATIWEDEASMCFQIEAGGICVARRDDNHMINGTKLLNVAGMTRGRRDGILKSEKTRHVVKIGPMHLKGVWIPFDRALDFANKEKITEKLYPLFVHNIGALLYHPNNAARQSIPSATMASADRRRTEGQTAEYVRTPHSSQPPTLQHHHSMANSIGGHVSHLPHSIAPHPGAGRPGLDRAHTFPTPPTSASSNIGVHAGGPYGWSAASESGVQSQQPLSIDTAIGSTRSVPTTPASTPPGNSMPSMSAYPSSQPYDGPRHMYSHSASSATSAYGSQQGLPRFAQLQPSPYIKNEMAPPARIGGGNGGEAEHNGDMKPRDAYGHEHPPSSDDHTEHEGDYTHSTGPYGSGRNPYTYNPQATPTASHQNHHSHVSPEMTGSPHKGSGRATPRTATYPGYGTPERQQPLPASSLYTVMGDNRNPNGGEMYNGGYTSQGYPHQNGMQPGVKRGIDMDEAGEYGRSNEDTDGLKRRKTVREGSAGVQRPRAMVSHKKR